MIDQATALKIQAAVDGQLPSAQARDVARLLEENPEAQGIYRQVQAIHTVLAENPPLYTLPESREFYWSKIAREIQRTEPAVRRTASREYVSWLRWLLPVGATAAVLMAVLVHGPFSRPRPPFVELAVEHEIETPLPETTSFSFRSESAAITVVWVETSGIHNLGGID
jgi:anti-sigma factor RsiW